MKILMMVTWYSPHNAKVFSSGVFHYEQAIALQKYNDVAVFFPFDGDLDCDFLKDEEKGVLTFRGRESKNKFLKFVKYISDFKNVLKHYKPDVIHAHVALGAGRIAVILGKLFNIPVIITEHYPIEMMNLDNKKNWLVCDFVYGNSKKNICVSSDLKEKLSEHFQEKDFSVIYNGVIDPLPKVSTNQTYAIPGYVNCSIVALFYNKEVKGYQFLLPAIKELVDRGIKIKLHICGAGEYMEFYQNMANDLGIVDNCIFYGSCDKEKVYSIVSQMDFCVSASLFESAGVSVQEAMLLGKPLVVTKSGGASSLVTKESAIVVDTGSTDALVDGMIQMIESKLKFNSSDIREYALDNFEIDNIAQQHIKLYENILGV